ncbi:hypothetical protein CathTA2_0832 [Caldalkalibacillus thermarum TA2.A1]|uniref:Uncharacterized protein n=1 Tax=Caldalkalibacillus thermarum (strain TA2.A1) TaxID=986075 RepID=F5L4W9_CALTT|nr:hypothetical protein [Caldalkalibacillus thermarum]EGL83621.1 hypothetical protein CathTA2_0832 [Caldalkalibacillus thermarum TA2.A1]QZT33696.1 hypothetical protein HUR95_15965 [Caldalkalibacillus thermarum TA2.A1]
MTETKSRDGMYLIKDGKPIPVRMYDMEWLMRYGSEKEIIKHRYYIAHIISLCAKQYEQYQVTD